MRHDEPVTSVPKTDPMNDGAIEHSHPSFGMINVVRSQGGKKRMFGTETECHSTIRISIGEATVTQKLGRNWYYCNNSLVEVEMSPIQYAEMISNPNTCGQPCTITRTREKGNIVHRGIDTVTEFAEKQVDASLQNTKRINDSVIGEIKQIFEKKSIGKGDRQEVINLVNTLVKSISSDLPFYEKSVKEGIERTKAEAHAEIENFIAHVVTRAGLDSIQNGVDLLQLMKGEDDE